LTDADNAMIATTTLGLMHLELLIVEVLDHPVAVNLEKSVEQSMIETIH
jgi:hypothetical protein